MTPEKEPRFFSYDPELVPEETKRAETAKTMEQYQALFAGVKDEAAVGEASPSYFHSPIAPGRIHAHNPDARLVVILRHPVDRAYSHYMMMLKYGSVPYRPFDEMFRKTILNNPNWTTEPLAAYGCKISLYHDNLARYYQLFPREQILVLKYEDLMSSPETLLRELFTYLGVDPDFCPDTSRRHNVGEGLPRNAVIHNAITRPSLLKSIGRTILPTSLRKGIQSRLAAMNKTVRQPFKVEDHPEFANHYRDDIVKTQELTGVDLSHWLPS